jgi:hypothetical protein
MVKTINKTIKAKMLSQQNLPEKKIKIIEYIKKNGPSLPSALSNSINLSLLFTSALLSEIYREGRIKMSHLKIGSSPLYLIEGQEAQLDKFTKYLERKEQEALNNLKKEQVLEDEKIEPSHRVALRNIKDFAVMMKINVGGQEKLFWRLHTLQREQVENKLKEILSKGKIRKEIKIVKPKKEIKTEIKQEKIEKPKRKPRQRKKKEEVEGAIKDYLSANNLAIEEEINDGDLFAIVSSTTQLGRLRFLVIAKNKKRISDSDITLALHSGQKTKMPVLFLTPGKLSKKAEKYAEENRGLVILKNVKL